MGQGFPFGSARRVMTGLLEPTDPEPRNFIIDTLEQCGDFVIALIRYPNCTTFEGKKILVFEGLSAIEIAELSTLDPHFTEKGNIVARFKPGARGWTLARAMCGVDVGGIAAPVKIDA